MDLSIIIPSIRPHYWQQNIQDISESINGFEYEIIFVGPDCEQDLPNHCSFLQDYGWPTRCIQLGVSKAKGKYVTWISDDGRIYKNAYQQCLESFISDSTQKDIMCLRYTENNIRRPLEYFHAHYHDDLRLDGIAADTLFAPIGLLHRNRYIEIGGLDCSFIHCNMSCIDLSIRLQKDSGNVVLSPCEIGNFIWLEGTSGDHLPIHNAELNHDIPKFKKLYSNITDRANIEFDNYKLVPTKWKDRYDK